LIFLFWCFFYLGTLLMFTLFFLGTTELRPGLQNCKVGICFRNAFFNEIFVGFVFRRGFSFNETFINVRFFFFCRFWSLWTEFKDISKVYFEMSFFLILFNETFINASFFFFFVGFRLSLIRNVC